ncbi:MAG: TPM domain-containing protein [Sphingomonas sp.]|nr:TPM domain-containing protein [Sphingomonas sp.]
MRLLLLFLALVAAAPAAAQTFPELTGRVVDNAALLDAAQEEALTGRLAALEQATTRQLVVATVPDLQGYPIEDYANRLFRHWQLGQADADNGALLLVALAERRMRIEVGYGLEPVLTDALAGRIIRDDITPFFRAGDYPGGIAAGADAIIAQLQASPEEAEAQAAAALAAATADRERGDGSMLPIFMWIGIIGLVLLALASRAAKGRSYRTGNSLGWIILWELLEEASRNNGSSGGSSWGSGGSSWGGGGGGWSGGGGFSGGGGSSGGGGASGGW